MQFPLSKLTFSALAPDLTILAPWRDASFRERFPGRKEMIEYCITHKIDVEASASKPYSMDRNLWHISYEAGILEDPWFDPTTPNNREMYKLSVDPEVAPDQAVVIWGIDILNQYCVVAKNINLREQLAKILNKIVCEGVVIIDNKKAHIEWLSLIALFSISLLQA